MVHFTQGQATRVQLHVAASVGMFDHATAAHHVVTKRWTVQTALTVLVGPLSLNRYHDKRQQNTESIPGKSKR